MLSFLYLVAASEQEDRDYTLGALNGHISFSYVGCDVYPVHKIQPRSTIRISNAISQVVRALLLTDVSVVDGFLNTPKNSV
jgi:hypothetical protein